MAESQNLLPFSVKLFSESQICWFTKTHKFGKEFILRSQTEVSLLATASTHIMAEAATNICCVEPLLARRSIAILRAVVATVKVGMRHDAFSALTAQHVKSNTSL